MCNLYSDLLTFLCSLLVHRDWFCLFFNTRSDFWVLFDMSVIYFIYIDAVMCLRFGRHDSSYPKSCFYCRTPFSVEQKNSSIFPWPVICQPKNTAVLYQDFPEL